MPSKPRSPQNPVEQNADTIRQIKIHKIPLKTPQKNCTIMSWNKGNAAFLQKKGEIEVLIEKWKPTIFCDRWIQTGKR